MLKQNIKIFASRFQFEQCRKVSRLQIVADVLSFRRLKQSDWQKFEIFSQQMQVFAVRLYCWHAITCIDNGIKMLRHYSLVSFCHCKALGMALIVQLSSNELIVSMERHSIFVVICWACDLCRRNSEIVECHIPFPHTKRPQSCVPFGVQTFNRLLSYLCIGSCLLNYNAIDILYHVARKNQFAQSQRCANTIKWAIQKLTCKYSYGLPPEN